MILVKPVNSLVRCGIELTREDSKFLEQNREQTKSAELSFGEQLDSALFHLNVESQMKSGRLQ